MSTSSKACEPTGLPLDAATKVLLALVNVTEYASYLATLAPTVTCMLRCRFKPDPAEMNKMQASRHNELCCCDPKTPSTGNIGPIMARGRKRISGILRH
jgi:hypothetical protein